MLGAVPEELPRGRVATTEDVVLHAHQAHVSTYLAFSEEGAGFEPAEALIGPLPRSKRVQ